MTHPTSSYDPAPAPISDAIEQRRNQLFAMGHYTIMLAKYQGKEEKQTVLKNARLINCINFFNDPKSKQHIIMRQDIVFLKNPTETEKALVKETQSLVNGETEKKEHNIAWYNKQATLPWDNKDPSYCISALRIGIKFAQATALHNNLYPSSAFSGGIETKATAPAVINPARSSATLSGSTASSSGSSTHPSSAPTSSNNSAANEMAPPPPASLATHVLGKI